MGELAYISIGSNLGKRRKNVANAIHKIEKQAGRVTKISPFYNTAPIGFDADRNFLNACIEIETHLSPEDLLHALNHIESKLGRVRNNQIRGYQSRTIDLDIILYSNLIIDTPVLQIPHLRFRERLFVLQPLHDIAPDLVDPISTKTIQQLYVHCKDDSMASLPVSKINAND